ncbi:MAG TPA: NifU family protein [Planctomycetota bacterium]|nr:NifU family protein [Planctomycetota bacterium]
MEQVIRITAKLSPNPKKCVFEVDRMVYEGGVAYFSDKAQAEGSPLAEKLLAIPHVVQVVAAGAVVTVVQDGQGAWATLAKECGAAIRAALQSGQPPVKPGYVSALPAEEVIREKVQKVLDFEVNPAVAGHGGFIEIVDVRDKAVVLKMGGGCQGCSSSAATLYEGVAKAIKDKVPEVAEVIDSTDHAAGATPYYR